MTTSRTAIRTLCSLTMMFLFVGQAFGASTRIPNFTSQAYKKAYAGQAPASILPYWHGFHFWKKSVGKEAIPQLTYWTEHLYTEVSKANNLLSVDPKGIRHLCPKYVNLDREKKIQFWTRLISIMASYESGYSAKTTFNEPSMPGVKSIGLLQLSNMSAAIPEYQCSMIVPEAVARDRDLLFHQSYKNVISKNLMDPKKNLSCGVRIMNYWIGRDKVLVDNVRDPSDGDRYWRGLARFWGVFRHPRLKDATSASYFWSEIDQRRPRWQNQSRKRDALTRDLLQEVRRRGEPWGHQDWKLKSSEVPHPSLMEDYYSQYERHKLTAIVRLSNQTAFCF